MARNSWNMLTRVGQLITRVPYVLDLNINAAYERELEFQMCSTRGFPILWLADIRFQCHLDTSL